MLHSRPCWMLQPLTWLLGLCSISCVCNLTHKRSSVCYNLLFILQTFFNCLRGCQIESQSLECGEAIADMFGAWPIFLPHSLFELIYPSYFLVPCRTYVCSCIWNRPKNDLLPQSTFISIRDACTIVLLQAMACMGLSNLSANSKI